MSNLLWGIKRGKTVKNIPNIRTFREICSNYEQFAWITSESHKSFFLKERWEWFALLKRAMWANCSLLLYKMSNFERKSEERKSEFPTLGWQGYIYIYICWSSQLGPPNQEGAEGWSWGGKGNRVECYLKISKRLKWFCWKICFHRQIQIFWQANPLIS